MKHLLGMKRIIILAALASIVFTVKAQTYSAYTDYAWDSWGANSWNYVYSDGWVYAIPYGENPRDFYFRFNYGELGLHELDRKQWKTIKAEGGWLKYLTCTFEYYVTDEYPTIKNALAAHSWPCAKYYHSTSSGMPIVKRTTKVRVDAYYSDDDEVRTLNFWFVECGFALSVMWDYSGYRMTYHY